MKNRTGRPLALVTACNLVFMPPWCARSAARVPFLCTQAGRRAIRFQVGRIDHDRLALGTLSGQGRHDPGKAAIVAPTLPAVVGGLGRAILPGCVAPSQPIAIDEDHAAGHPSIIDPRIAMAFRKEGLQALHLRVAQPVKIAYPSGLLAEPESCKRLRNNGWEAQNGKAFRPPATAGRPVSRARTAPGRGLPRGCGCAGPGRSAA